MMFGFNIFLGGLAGGLKKGRVTSSNYNTTGIKDAIGGSAGNSQIQFAIADLVQQVLGLSVKEETGTDNQKNKHITSTHNSSASLGDNKVKVIINDETSPKPKEVTVSTGELLAAGNKVTITITLKDQVPDLGNKGAEAKKIANKIWDAAKKAQKQDTAGISAERDFSAFQYIAFHDILAMFFRFVYGKFAVGYNWT